MINISTINEYTFCPYQAYNSLNKENITKLLPSDSFVARNDSFLEDLKNNFYDYIKTGKLLSPDKRTVKSMMQSNTVSHISELGVISEKEGLQGYCDEAQVSSNGITLIEYKTTKQERSHDFNNDPAINQLIAYAHSFQEYFDAQATITLRVIRIFLRDKVSFINRCLLNPIGHDGSSSLGESETSDNINWAASMEIIYEKAYKLELLNRVKPIIQRIKKADFSHQDNRSRCKKCKYKYNCCDSLAYVPGVLRSQLQVDWSKKCGKCDNNKRCARVIRKQMGLIG
ncbi:MAG: PD-(D/E)XK nuclease family protein [archaeon]